MNRFLFVPRTQIVLRLSCMTYATLVERFMNKNTTNITKSLRITELTLNILNSSVT
jgi:hypothetical protein